MTTPLRRVRREAVRDLAARERLAVCLDVDGTLAPIVPNPHDARVPAPIRATLERLRQHPSVALIVVSGRGADDARRVVGTRVDWTIANHGFEVAPGNGAAQPFAPNADRRKVRRAAQRVARAVRDLPGVRFEDKGWTLSVHFRQAPYMEDAVWRQVRAAARGTGARLYGGKRVLEVRPPGTWNKGTALQRLLTQLYGRPWRATTGVVFAGDDETDEHVFSVLDGRAMTIKVGAGRTRARYRTTSPATFTRWLRDFERLIP